MSEFGSVENPDMNVARLIAQDMHFMPLDKANAMQWDSGAGILDMKIAHRKTNSNIHFLFDTDA